MINAIKLFKLNFKNNKKIFTIFIIFSIILCIGCFLLAGFYTKNFLNMVSINEKYFLYTITKSVTAINYSAITISAIFFTMYMIVTLYTRFNNSDGTLYTIVTLPVNRNAHIFSIVLESLIFVAIQFVLINILIRINYHFIIRELREINNVVLSNLLDYFSKPATYTGYLNQYNIFNINIINIIYSFLVTYPIITMAYIFIYQFFKKYKITTLVILIIFFIIAFFISAKGYTYSVFNIPFKIVETIFRRDFNFGISLHNLKILTANLVALITLTLVNLYIFKRKTDF